MFVKSVTVYRIVVLNFIIVMTTYATEHRTKAASEKHHELSCYRCDSMIDGEKCIDISPNYTHFHHKCSKDQRKCQVKRISMSTSTKDTIGKPKLWLLQRNCTESCESGCIVIGERTKLHCCTACCDEQNFCNIGSGSCKVQFTLLNWIKINLMNFFKYF